MVRPEILVDGEVVDYNRGNLDDRVAHVPTGTDVATIAGDKKEHASASFYDRLKTGAELVGAHADVVSSAVKQNADALKQTVEALQESDKTSADEATKLTELVEGTAQTTTDATVADSAQTRSAEQDSSGGQATGGDQDSDEGGS